MKYFSLGLTKEELKKEYRKLVAAYHPDKYNKDGEKSAEMTEKLKEINAEYDACMKQRVENELGDVLSAIRRYQRELPKELKFVFLSFDKIRGEGYFFLEQGLFGPKKYQSDDNPAWKNIRGGFRLVQLHPHTSPFSDRWFSPVSAGIECPTLKDMCNAILGMKYTFVTGGMLTKEQAEMSGAYVSRWGKYQLVQTKRHGRMWLSVPYNGKNNKTRTAFMLVNGLIMSAEVPRKILTDMEILEEYDGYDIPFLVYQRYTCEEFRDRYDVDYTPQYSDALGCKPLNDDEDLLWIDNPTVSHFARTGMISFWQSGRNYNMRYGTFNSSKLEKEIYKLDEDDADEIQEYFNKLNSAFEDYIARMIRKGTIRIDTTQRHRIW